MHQKCSYAEIKKNPHINQFAIALLACICAVIVLILYLLGQCSYILK